jgi:uncharacterized integral membrane protein (TIGR00697 family)
MASPVSVNQKALRLYLFLSAIFIASLVACNLIFQKFFVWQPFTWANFNAAEGSTWHNITHYAFEISVGIIPYPITFLVTDLISEIFGRKKANQLVIAGLFAAVFVLIIVLLANGAEATSWSPVNDDTFSQVFGLTGVAVGASMAAYLLAQLVDVRLFHFWKTLTKGKHLWLRNNFSTILSQLVDTSTVLILLCGVGAIAWDKFWILLANGFLFKVLVALFDTPIFYAVTYWARKTFNLAPGEEIGIVE